MGFIKDLRNYFNQLSLEESVVRTAMEQSFYPTERKDPMQTAYECFDVETIPQNRCAFYDAMRRNKR